MAQRRRRTTIGYAIAVGALLALFVTFSSLVDIYTEWLWFASLGQQSTYQTRLWSQVGLWLAGALLVILVLVVNWFLIPRRLLDQLQLPLRGRMRQILTAGSRVPTAILRVVAALVALVMASEASARWMDFLTFRHAVPFGLRDPIFGLDASFYVFKLPLYRFLVGWVLVLVTATLIGNGLVYLFTQQIQGRTATTHLSVLGALLLFGSAVDYQLQRFALLNSSRGGVFGAGYTDVHARLPLLHLLTGVFVLGALLLTVNIFTRRWRWLLIVGGVGLALGVLGSLYPGFVQRFTVQPNELALERPYIEHNIRFTRFAYGVEDIQESDYAATGQLTAQTLEANADIVDNVRLWDWRPLRTTYEQLQEIRTYYTFADVDVDRYTLDGRLREVTLAARELDIEQLREDARTWINQHLIYTHGYGLCLSPVAEVSAEGLPHLLVRDIPPQSADPALAITRPEIYFGETTTNYVIVNTTEDEFDYPSGDQNVYTRYQGPDGVGLGGLLRRLAFAHRFDSTSILLSNAIGSDSRILFHRSLSDRVETLAPILWFDDDPYPAIVDGRIVWLYDAYTWSNRFPYSEPGWNSEPVWGLNYIRNSVKITIDAYTGKTVFYAVDPADPLIRTYQAIFPALFTPGEEMDETLREHWRYPEQLFLIQADIYAAYHMQDPRVFYNQEDLWQTPTEVRDTEETWMTPYYVIMRLPGEQAPEFMMIRPYVPAGKQNMIAWLYADSDGPDYGHVGVYKFSKEALVYGPIQVEARIDQDPYISQQLTLWNQRGSSVIRGNLIVIPIDGTLLYIEPLYLQAESGRLPELKRVLVSHGNRVAMADDLATGLAQVVSEAPATPPVEPPPTDVAALSRSAQAHYEAAQECLQGGDWACYGAELEALAHDLEALVAATGTQ
ncbi:MAG TPA: UPF0182 family protein [Anaerolineae bacterium]|nr:UPF0182 family protein [Anaerolineae bacterium]